MNSSRINDWLTLVANDVTSLAINIGHADAFAKLVSDAELSPDDQLRLSFMWALDLRNREFEYFHYTNGLLDEETWLSYRQVLLINHSAGPGRKWWDHVGRRIVDPQFARSVDELRADAGPDGTYERMATWADD